MDFQPVFRPSERRWADGLPADVLAGVCRLCSFQTKVEMEGVCKHWRSFLASPVGPVFHRPASNFVEVPGRAQDHKLGRLVGISVRALLCVLWFLIFSCTAACRKLASSRGVLLTLTSPATPLTSSWGGQGTCLLMI